MRKRDSWRRSGVYDVLELLDHVLSEEVTVSSNKSQTGESLRVTIPKRLARALGLRPGDRVRVTLDPARRRLILEKA